MAHTLTIRNLDDDLKALLRLQAARSGHSMEQEARDILRRALTAPADGPGLAQRIRARFAGLDADTLPIPARRPARRPDLSPDSVADPATGSLDLHPPAPPAYSVIPNASTADGPAHPPAAPVPSRRRKP